MSFIEVDITTNESEIADEALEKLEQELAAKGVVGWVPNEADLEIIVLNTVASMVVPVAQIAAVVPAAIFRKFGTELIKLLYNEGAAATVSTIWTLTDTAGHTIEAGTQLTLGELAFYVESNVVVEAGHNTATVVLVASERGTEYNKLTGIVELVDAIAWVQEVTIIGESTGGVDQEDDEQYQNRLSAALQLQAPRPVNAADYAPFVLGVPSSILPTGIVVGRATSLEGYNAETKEENIERCVTTFVTDPEGKAISKSHMETLETWLRTFREISFLAFIEEPTYTKIYVTSKVHILKAYNAEAVVANIKSALESLLSPKNWGNPTGQTSGINAWVNEKPSKVRYNVILGTIEAVPGVAYVYPGAEGLKTGTTATPTKTEDIVLSGPAPLTETAPGNLVITAE